MIPIEEQTIEVRTDLPRTEWKQSTVRATSDKKPVLSKRTHFQNKGQHNLLGRKPTGAARKGKSSGAATAAKKKT